MTHSRVYLTTTIPYVNAAPHLGFALEAVQADVLARHHRARGDRVRLLTGTDDNSLKNVLAAQAAGVPVADLVDRNADRFAALREPLACSFDDFIRTSRDPRHRPGVDRFWRACARSGDLYRARYEGLYCVGCEHYLTEDELDARGCCPEHAVPPVPIAEDNWFFRLSRYAGLLREVIGSGRLRIEPASRRNEVLSFIEGGLRDFSISRSRERARGWGIPVPDDPSQVIYVWWDALGNYVTALDYGGTGPGGTGPGEDPDGEGTGQCPDGAGPGAGTGDAYRTWWAGSDRRVHVIGKGVLRFHAVYWPAMLASAGLPLPTDILVHDYLTVNGQKISKSAGTSVDPVALAGRFGTDAVRWWLLREVPRVGDADFTVERLVARADDDLAGGIGNLVNRVVTMVHRYRGGRSVRTGLAGADDADRELVAVCDAVPGQVDEALEGFDFRRATAAVFRIVEQANRYIELVRPWELARAERSGEPTARRRLDRSLALLLRACRRLGEELAPFLPGAAARVIAQCSPVDQCLPTEGVLPPAGPLFPRIAGSDAATPRRPVGGSRSGTAGSPA